MYFPPGFFDIMVHLIVHLVREIKCCGPVFLRWMYLVERYMKILKGYTKNLHRPKASIVERYIAEWSVPVHDWRWMVQFRMKKYSIEKTIKLICTFDRKGFLLLSFFSLFYTSALYANHFFLRIGATHSNNLWEICLYEIVMYLVTFEDTA